MRKRVEPQRGPGPPGVAVAADGKVLPARAGLGRIDVPPEPPPGRAGRALHGSHQRDGLRPEDPDFPELAAAQQHPAEAGEIGRGEKQPRMAGHAPHPPGGGVMDDPAQDGAIRQDFRGRDAGGIRRHGEGFCRRIEPPETGVAHTERAENLPGAVGIERDSGHPLDEVA